MNIKVILTVLTPLLSNLASGSPLAVPDVPTILGDITKIGEDLTKLNELIKAFTPTKDQTRIIQNAMNAVNIDMIKATSDARATDPLNDQDSKTVTDAAMHMKPAIEQYLTDLVSKKSLFQEAKYQEAVQDSIVLLQDRCFPLAEALENIVNETDGKAMATCVEDVDKALDKAIADFD